MNYQFLPKVSSSKNGKEINFIVNQKIALEVKETGTKEDYANLGKLATTLGLKEWYIITRHHVDLPGFIPAYLVRDSR